MRQGSGGGQHPRQPESCHCVKLPALLVKHTAGDSDTKIRRGGVGALILLQVAVFCLCVLFMTIVITFRTELKKHAEILQAAGWDDKREAT